MTFLTIEKIRSALLDEKLRDAQKEFVSKYMPQNRKVIYEFVDALRPEVGIKITKDFLNLIRKKRSKVDYLMGQAAFYEDSLLNRHYFALVGRVSTGVKIEESWIRWGSIKPFLKVELNINERNENIDTTKYNLPEEYMNFNVSYSSRHLANTILEENNFSRNI